jgi:hypothetical protein
MNGVLIVAVSLVLRHTRLGDIVFVSITSGITLWFAIVLWFAHLRGTGRIVVSTNQRLLVFLRRGRHADYLRELPRDTPITSPSGSGWRPSRSTGEKLYLTPRGAGPSLLSKHFER